VEAPQQTTCADAAGRLHRATRSHLQLLRPLRLHLLLLLRTTVVALLPLHVQAGTMETAALNLRDLRL
jgi:hypothetical protein